jgi:hypothetical protein
MRWPPAPPSWPLTTIIYLSSRKRTMSDAQAKPFCINCVSGDVLPGEPRGSLARIGPFDTYVAQPSTPAANSEGVAIVYFVDAFGLQLKNNKILPDMIADGTGLPVYVPDVRAAADQDPGFCG